MGIITVSLALLFTLLRLASPALAQTDAMELARRSLADRAPRWRCDSTRAMSCSADGCKDIERTVWIILDFKAEAYERCDAKGCDRRDLKTSASGIFTTITLTGGTFLKALNDGTDFVDVASLFTGVFLNFGRCRAIE